MCAKSQHESIYFQYVMDFWKKIGFALKKIHNFIFSFDMGKKKSYIFSSLKCAHKIKSLISLK
jgi:hypothetical protein